MTVRTWKFASIDCQKTLVINLAFFCAHTAHRSLDAVLSFASHRYREQPENLRSSLLLVMDFLELPHEILSLILSYCDDVFNVRLTCSFLSKLGLECIRRVVLNNANVVHDLTRPAGFSWLLSLSSQCVLEIRNWTSSMAFILRDVISHFSEMVVVSTGLEIESFLEVVPVLSSSLRRFHLTVCSTTPHQNHPFILCLCPLIKRNRATLQSFWVEIFSRWSLDSDVMVYFLHELAMCPLLDWLAVPLSLHHAEYESFLQVAETVIAPCPQLQALVSYGGKRDTHRMLMHYGRADFMGRLTLKLLQHCPRATALTIPFTLASVAALEAVLPAAPAAVFPHVTALATAHRTDEQLDAMLPALMQIFPNVQHWTVSVADSAVPVTALEELWPAIRQGWPRLSHICGSIDMRREMSSALTLPELAALYECLCGGGCESAVRANSTSFSHPTTVGLSKSNDTVLFAVDAVNVPLAPLPRVTSARLKYSGRIAGLLADTLQRVHDAFRAQGAADAETAAATSAATVAAVQDAGRDDPIHVVCVASSRVSEYSPICVVFVCRRSRW